MSLLFIYVFRLFLIWESSCEMKGEVQVDEFQSVFVFDENTLLKYDQEGKNHFVYSNLRNGDISSLDITNPLRLVVYYGENNQVVFLDNTLSEQVDGMNFNDLSFYDVTLVSSSFQNHLWVYRSAEQKLARLNRNGDVVNETANIGLWIDADLDEYVMLKESGNYLYLVGASGEVLVFDQYGTYRKKLLLEGAEKYHFSDSKILYLHGSQVMVYDVNLNDMEVFLELSNVQLQADEVDFNLNHFCVLRKKKLTLSRVSK